MLQHSEMSEALRQWCLEDLLNRIYDFARIKSDIGNQAESDKQSEILGEVIDSLNTMIEKSCRYRATNYYGPGAGS